MRKNGIAVTCSLIGFFYFIIFFSGNVFGESNPFGNALIQFTGEWFSVKIPDNWKSNTSQSGETVFLTAPGGLIQTSGNNNVVLGMSVAQRPVMGGDSASVVSGAMDSLLADNPGTTILSRKATSWQGKPAERLTLAGTNSGTGASEVSEILAVVSDGTLAFFALTVPEDIYENWNQSIADIIGSISIQGLLPADPISSKTVYTATALSRYISTDKIYALHKPAAWKAIDTIGPDFYRVKVISPDEASLVDFYWARNLSGKTEAVSALPLYREILSRTYQKVTVDKAWRTSDLTRIAADMTLHGAGVEMKGRFYIETTDTGISVQGYAAPEKILSSRRPMLLSIMSSMAFLKVLHQREASEPPVQATLVTRRAPDGSLTVRLPGDWDFLAAQGKIVAGAPGGGMGFIFTAFSGNPMLPDASIAQGVIGSRYLTPAQTVPFLLQEFGHSNPGVTSSTQDTATIAAGQATLGRDCDAADISATWMSSGGISCMGVFKVMNTLPAVMGQWSSVVMGIWGPQTDFVRYVPLLEQVANSYAINDAFARSYIQSGLANLRRLQQKTAAAIQSLNDARADNQAAWEARQERKDYMDSKWDDYRRGNSYWVSDLEGGKIYQTDSSGIKDMGTGDYYEGSGYSQVNFEGQNPRHPSEDMSELSSYEVEHGGKPD